jgi:putative hemolysin
LIDEEETGYATIAGYFMGRMDRIPKAGDQVSADGFTAEVLDMDGNRIDKVLITLKED